MFEKFTGLFIAAIITIINKSVFDDNEVHWKHYSAAISAFDLIAIIYLCYVSQGAENILLESTSAKSIGNVISAQSLI